jgi:hypothetical protein
MVNTFSQSAPNISGGAFFGTARRKPSVFARALSPSIHEFDPAFIYLPSPEGEEGAGVRGE